MYHVFYGTVSWPWSYSSWIYSFLCNQYTSPLMLWVRIPRMRGVLDTFCDKVCQWPATGRWFSRAAITTTKKWVRVRGYGALSHFQQYFSYIVAVSFICGGNRSTWRKPPTCRRSLTNFITKCIEYTSHAWDSNSQH
jgi:hypothetical protein